MSINKHHPGVHVRWFVCRDQRVVHCCSCKVGWFTCFEDGLEAIPYYNKRVNICRVMPILWGFCLHLVTILGVFKSFYFVYQ